MNPLRCSDLSALSFARHCSGLYCLCCAVLCKLLTLHTFLIPAAFCKVQDIHDTVFANTAKQL